MIVVKGLLLEQLRAECCRYLKVGLEGTIMLPLQFFNIVSGDEKSYDQEPEENGIGPSEAS